MDVLGIKKSPILFTSYSEVFMEFIENSFLLFVSLSFASWAIAVAMYNNSLSIDSKIARITAEVFKCICRISVIILIFMVLMGELMK